MKKQYLPYYLNSKHAKVTLHDIIETSDKRFVCKMPEYNVEPELHLRKISDITFREAAHIAKLAFGLDKHTYPLTDYRAKQNLTSIEVYINNDHYMQTCMIGKSGMNIWVLQNIADKKGNFDRVYNNSHIYHYMLHDCGFDIFELIHKKLATEIQKEITDKHDIKIDKNFITLRD